MSSLVDIYKEYNALESLIIESNGELNETLEVWLAEIDALLEQKADSYSFALDRFESSAEMLRAKAKQYLDAAKALENTRERLKDRIKFVMQATGKSEIKGSDITFKLSNSAPKLVIDEDNLSGQYKIAVTQVLPDKERIKTDLKAGKEIEGARFEPVKSLRVNITK